MFTLFVLITLDNWSNMYEDVRDKDTTIFIFLVVFIIIESFILINLFVAVIVNNLEAMQRQAQEKRAAEQVAASKARSQQEKASQERQLLEVKRNNSMFRMAGPIEDASPRGTAVKLGKGHDNDQNLPPHLPTRLRSNMGRVLMLLASLENTLDTQQSQHEILDMLVDVLDPAAVESTSPLDAITVPPLPAPS
eukprot:TRINITY_DN8909_c0_g1_i3.p1 TRINITY_DN8909_c0_g1~~TRINITY_DN8909_c0_g1_i3.p1  ORF type:complete len:193 (+),score=56.55 TRINITY_DN8909_c0_g1_i3:75-653(+)